MSERRYLNIRYPADFDPSLLPKRKGPDKKVITVRIMAPFNMSCHSCGDCISKGRKFNSCREDVQGEDYLGIKIFRFQFKCPFCLADIFIKTDPGKADYAVETGAARLPEAEELQTQPGGAGTQ